jgi:hypothetical protein
VIVADFKFSQPIASHVSNVPANSLKNTIDAVMLETSLDAIKRELLKKLPNLWVLLVIFNHLFPHLIVPSFHNTSSQLVARKGYRRRLFRLQQVAVVVAVQTLAYIH